MFRRRSTPQAAAEEDPSLRIWRDVVYTPETWAESFRKHGPFGDAGHTLGARALDLAVGLSRPKTPTPEPGTWSADDLTDYGHLHDLEGEIIFLEPAPDPFLDGSDQAEFHRRLTRLHAALPFSESERLWLQRIDHLGRRLAEGTFAEHVSGLDAEVFNAGIRQIIPGAELIRRWAAWRREADEYAAQGSLREARRLLGQIGEQLLPEGALLSTHPTYRCYREYVEQVRPTLDI